MKRLYLLLLTLISTHAGAQELFTLRGTIKNAATREQLPAANIRLAGTSHGTVANADGEFRLLLREGTYTLIVSSLAYKPDTSTVAVHADTRHDIALTPADIVLPEVVVTSEDPAVEIMRRAIANKKKWMDRLQSFTFEAFTRQVLKRDTAIASITESFTTGYWQQSDTLREIVKQKRQTKNVKSEFNFASVGRILNFNEDEIRFIGYTFVGPTAAEALDYYDYKLLRTLSSHGKDVYEISMTPRSRTAPLFEGTINIAGDSYALMGVDVHPNESFSIPFVKEQFLRYRQQFGLYEQSFWMPTDIRIDVSATIGIIGFSIPPITFSQTSVITDYALNAPIPDSVFQKPRLTIDTIAVATIDSGYWHQNNVLPLTVEETQAYTSLDSTQTLDVQFRPRGISFQVGMGDGSALAYGNFLDVSFNRVEGFHGGLKAEFDSLINQTEFRANIAYGFSDKRWKYNFGATVFATRDRRFGIGIDVYRKIDHRPDAGFYGDIYNSLTSIFVKNDYRDYYQAEGGKLFLTARPSEIARFEIAFLQEEHVSVSQRSDFSIFARSRSYRPNPPVRMFKELKSILLEGRIGREEAPLGIVSSNSFDFAVESGDDGSPFARYSGAATFSVPTLGRSRLIPAALRMRVAAGTSSGQLPPQRKFDLESASSNVAPFGVFKAMNVKEFGGTSFFAITMEHNFRSLPFLAVGIPFLYKNNIEFIVHGGVARTWDRDHLDGYIYVYGQPPLQTTGGWYSEAGFGFSRIFEFLRADFTWRLSSPSNFRFTLGVANLF
ncbi:MAG: carboxypeptidase-like regulatory domain-containing protein [Ignavibacteriae bacterium]|nr:carboxypeptidase-like regulatory domain-containing protein [Ignavibacteriota bacterium]